MAFQKSYEPELKILDEPACKHLLSKGMFITGLRDPSQDPIGGVGDGHCWCNVTQAQMGPDNSLVDRPLCNSQRPCYERSL